MNPELSNSRAKLIRDKTHVSLLAIFILFTIFISLSFLLLIKNAFHGFDITDEGMYLLSVHKVSNEMAFHNPFGDYTGILFRLCLQKVWLFRIGGYFVLGMSGVYVSKAISQYLPENSHRITKWIVITSGLLVVPFYYALGILSPSYNWLNLCCITLGLGVLTNFALSTAIWIGTFAKLSTGLGILLISVVIPLMLRRSLRSIFKNLAIQSVSVLLLAVLHQLFISPLSLVAEKISRGQHALEILDPQYSISLALRSFRTGASHWLQTLLGYQFILMLIFIFISIAISRRWSRKKAGGTSISILLIMLPILSVIDSFTKGDWAGYAAKYNDQMWAVTQILSVGLTIFVVSSVAKRTFDFSLSLKGLAILGGPVLYAFGSNNGFIEQITGASGLIALLAILLLTFDERTKGILLAIACLVLSLGAFHTTLEAGRNPYRQAPISQQEVLIEISAGGGRLYVERNFAEDVNSLRSQLKKKGWRDRTPMLDFTKYSAGIVYALDAQQPITIIPTVGGLPGVNELADWSLRYINDNDPDGNWSSAWILLPSEKNLAVCELCPDTAALRHLNRIFPTDYELVATSTNFRIYRPRD
jgi:hypothetical protein